MSNNEAKFQASFVVLHVYAGVLAAIAVVLHFTAAWYHARRLRAQNNSIPIGRPATDRQRNPEAQVVHLLTRIRDAA